MKRIKSRGFSLAELAVVMFLTTLITGVLVVFYAQSRLTLERGVTHDPTFEAWANLTYSTEGNAAVSLKNYKRDLILDLRNLQGTTVKSYRIFRCWVSEYTALPELDANANATAIESIVVVHEGFDRDEDIVEPEEF